MENIKNAYAQMNKIGDELEQRYPMPFDIYLEKVVTGPLQALRNVFQLFHDMMKFYVGGGHDEYPNDPESIHFVNYNFQRLFVDGSDNPFFADRLFANRLINHVEALKQGAQQNKIYIFEGPHGSGKSTFLNNLLAKFEEYTHTEDGILYEIVWRMDKKILTKFRDYQPASGSLVKSSSRIRDGISSDNIPREHFAPFIGEDYFDVPCPSHDHPILIIPKAIRRSFLDQLFDNTEFKWKVLVNKEYDWLFHNKPCTICSSMYDALLRKLGNPAEVLKAVYVRPYRFNRRLSQGISVFNPGDKPTGDDVLDNTMLQNRINGLFHDSNLVKYLYSRYAMTNNGIYALMDIKSHNVERLIELHNIISEGVHKVKDIEENVNSLFIALMNPEDKKNVQDFQSFQDRIEYISVSYVLDMNTEVEIYRNVFGRQIDGNFLPRVLHNFARIIIATRLSPRSEACLEWIGDPNKYKLYCDKNLQLLKMEIYRGVIPAWLSEDDRKRFTAKRRRRIIGESEQEGRAGFSGRDAIKVFNQFYSMHARGDKLITMSMLYQFFTRIRKDLSESVPQGFLDSLVQMYDYTVLQEVKESLYYYNEDQIAKDIQNYIFAVNFETGTTVTCHYTGDRLEISDIFLEGIETRLLGGNKIDRNKRLAFRKDTQKEYTSSTLTQELMVENKSLPQTALYRSLYERYVYNLKEKVLDPFLDNENFRRAIKDYDTEDYKTYDKRIREDVEFLLNNLCAKCEYTEQGAREACIYVIDQDLARKFGRA